MEDNKIYVKPGYESLKEPLLNQVERPALLEWMQEPLVTESKIMEDYKYELSLINVNSTEDYLQKYWSNKSKKNFLSQIKKIKYMNMTVEYDNFSDLELLAVLNKKRFGTESTLNSSNRLSFFYKIIEHYDAHVITISLQGKKEAVGFSVLYKNTYVGINSGTNREINGLGKFLSLQKIQQAINLHASLYDARTSDSGWKEAFRFQKRPQYILKLHNKSQIKQSF